MKKGENDMEKRMRKNHQKKKKKENSGEAVEKNGEEGKDEMRAKKRY